MITVIESNQVVRDQRRPRVFPTKPLALITTLVLALGAPSAHGFATEKVGATLSQTAAQMWWPEGLLKMAQDPARVYSREMNSLEIIFFDGNLEAVNRLLRAYGAVTLRDHIVEIKVGPVSGETLDKRSFDYALNLTVPDSIMSSRLSPDKPWPEPEVTLFVDSDLDPTALEIPENVIVRSTLFRYQGLNRNRPNRVPLHGQLVTSDVQVTALSVDSGLWHKLLYRATPREQPVCIGMVGKDGEFSVWLSREERRTLTLGSGQVLLMLDDAQGGSGADLIPIPPDNLQFNKKEIIPFSLAENGEL